MALSAQRCRLPAVPKPASLHLNAAEPAGLEGFARRGDVGQALAQPSGIVLACADQGSNSSGMTRRAGLGRISVTFWRARLLAHCLGGIIDLPLPVPRARANKPTSSRRARSLWRACRGRRPAGRYVSRLNLSIRASGSCPRSQSLFVPSGSPTYLSHVPRVIKPPSRHGKRAERRRRSALGRVATTCCQSASKRGSSALSVVSFWGPIKLCRSWLMQHAGRAGAGDRNRRGRTCWA